MTEKLTDTELSFVLALEGMTYEEMCQERDNNRTIKRDMLLAVARAAGVDDEDEVLQVFAGECLLGIIQAYKMAASVLTPEELQHYVRQAAKAHGTEPHNVTADIALQFVVDSMNRLTALEDDRIKEVMAATHNQLNEEMDQFIQEVLPYE